MLGLAMVISLTAWAGWMGRKNAIATGAGAAIVAALLNLLLLGSKLVEQPASTDELASAANQFRPNALLAAAAFVLFSAIAGLIAGVAGRALARRRASPPVDSTFAALTVAAAACFLPLLVVGGAVTSTESGMAVPDAVTSYGSLSFLFPISLMAGEWGNARIFLEHTHRLFGTLVGLVTLLSLVG
ncbi:MAG: hypothetical protein AAF235_03955, partial [Planctomycetota bacterium]